MMLVNVLGIALLFLIIWWFWLYKPKETTINNNELTITVENGVYSPSHIQVNSGSPISINFLRKDQSPCSESLVIPDLAISETLPLNKLKTINIAEMKPGKYIFHCQMNMYKGEITVT